MADLDRHDEPTAPAGNAGSVYAVVLNWNSGDDTRVCVESLLAMDAPIRVVVVDNGSSDGSGAMLSRHFDGNPAVVLLNNKENLGFTGGNNVGIDYAMRQGAAHILIINDDVRVAPDMLSQMMSCLKSDPKIGVVGAKIFYWEPRGGENILWYAGGRVHWALCRFSLDGMGKPDRGEFDNPQNLGYVVGCALLIPREVMEIVKGFDDCFFAYGEDVDLSLRIRNAGYKLAHCPKALIWHRTGGGDSQSAYRAHYLYYQTRNRFLIFCRTKNPLYNAYGFVVSFVLYVLLRGAYVALKGNNKREQLRAIFRGFGDYVGKRLGRRRAYG